MLKRLRREFIAITMALVGTVLLAVLGSTYVASYTSQHENTTAILRQALNASGSSADEAVPTIGARTTQNGESVLTIVVDISWSGDLLAVSNSRVTISSDALYSLINEVLGDEANQGHSGAYHIDWMRKETLVGYRMALVDTYSRDQQLRSQALTDLAIFAVAMAVFLLIVRRLASWALAPVEKAWEQQRRFVSDASHELKTPLAVILANTQILLGKTEVPADARRWIESTNDEATHMKGLVEDLLTLARADEGAAMGKAGSYLQKADIDLTALVDGCALEFDPVAFERGCSISCELAQDVHIMGDPTQIERVIRTLLDNATKYADKGSEVVVKLTVSASHHACLAINNHGEVIAPDALEHLFDRFYRTDDARERQQTGGFGLGLAIAKSTVEAHGGRIWATSSKEAGTTFSLEL